MKFNETISEFIDMMVHNQEWIMINHLIKIQSDIMNQISETAHIKQKQYYDRLNELKAYVIEDLKSFIEKQKQSIFKSIDAKYDVDRYQQLFIKPIYELVNDYKAGIRKVIFAADSKQKVKSICSESMPKVLEKFGQDCSNAFSNASLELNKRLKQLIEEVFKDFEESFEKTYSLKRITNHNIDLKQIVVEADISKISLAGAQTKIDDAMAISSTAHGLGAGAGVAIGTLIAPGIGTIIGGAIGWLLGSIFGPSLDEIKSKVYQEIADNFDHYFTTSILPAINREIYSCRDTLYNAAGNIIAEYLRRYELVVKNLIAEHERTKYEVESYIKGADEVIRDLKERRMVLEKLVLDIGNKKDAVCNCEVESMA